MTVRSACNWRDRRRQYRSSGRWARRPPPPAASRADPASSPADRPAAARRSRPAAVGSAAPRPRDARTSTALPACPQWAAPRPCRAAHRRRRRPPRLRGRQKRPTPCRPRPTPAGSRPRRRLIPVIGCLALRHIAASVGAGQLQIVGRHQAVAAVVPRPDQDDTCLPSGAATSVTACWRLPGRGVLHQSGVCHFSFDSRNILPTFESANL